jgi:predicted RecA/RadA family phage recombinase
MAIMELKSAEDYSYVTQTATGAVVAGTPTNVEECAGFPIIDGVSGDDLIYVTRASRVTALKATGAIAAGDKLYYDLSATVVTTTATDNVAVGYAVEAAASADASVLMDFNGLGVTLS